jgi:hypothetical protein
MGYVKGSIKRHILKPTLKARPFVSERLGNRFQATGAGNLAARMVGTSGKPPLAVPAGRHSLPPPGRRRGKFVVVYHNAYQAGPHTEAYVEDPETGIAHNVGVIRDLDPDHVKLNNDGWLTRDSKEYLKDVWRAKAHSRAWIAFSTDHRLHEARDQWNRPEDGPAPGEYGAGPLRQVIFEEDVEIYVENDTVHWVSWQLNPRQQMYVHKVFSETNVGVVGFKAQPEVQFEDRLHLTSDGQDQERFLRNVGEGHASEKIDGASCHFVSDKHGTRFFSPRHYDKGAGPRIEYSFKLGSLQDITSEQPTKGMAEIVLVDTDTGRMLSSTEIGGELNAHRLPPPNIQPRLYVYRIDNVGRNNTLHEPAWPDNRARCVRFASKHSQLDVPQEVALDAISSTRSSEGVVGVAPGKSLTEGRKLKWREDERDVIVTKVAFEPGPAGKVAGVVWYEDPATGRSYKTASGWTEAEKLEMMAQPEGYEGEVMKIKGFNGHGSRAAKFEGWHSDKDMTNAA